MEKYFGFSKEMVDRMQNPSSVSDPEVREAFEDILRLDKTIMIMEHIQTEVWVFKTKTYEILNLKPGKSGLLKARLKMSGNKKETLKYLKDLWHNATNPMMLVEKKLK